MAIAKVIGATEIYSDDGDIVGIAKDARIKVIGLADLPLPEEDRQGRLQLEGHADGQISEQKKKKAKPEDRQRPPDDFVSVARRLGADKDKVRFDAKLAKIVKAAPAKRAKGRR